MTIILESSVEVHDRFQRHLRAKAEQIAFAAAEPICEGTVTTLAVREVLLLERPAPEPADDELCVLLDDEDQQRVLNWAFDHDGWLIEAHSHIGWFGDPACMSPTDLGGLELWVPHVRWRLQRRGYAALVFGNRTLDGVGWCGSLNSSPVPVSKWVTPDRTYLSTCRTHQLMEANNA
jgi:hypothetical protein